jgi:hypothetical protein
MYVLKAIDILLDEGELRLDTRRSFPFRERSPERLP